MVFQHTTEQLHNEEQHDLSFTTNITRVAKSRRLKGVRILNMQR